MKKFGLLFSILFLVSQIAWGQLLNENFEYSVGQLDAVNGGADVSGGNWVNFSGTTLPIMVTAGSLTYSGYASSGIGNKVDVINGSAEDAYRQFTTQLEGTTTYASFLMNVTTTTGLALNTSTTGDYTVSFMPSTSTTTLLGRVSLKAGSVANTFNVGMRLSSSNTAAVFNATDYPINTPILVVFSYEIISGNTNDIANLWVNPAIGSSEPAADVTQTSGLTTDPVDVARITIRQGTNSFPGQLDGIRVGTSWNEVVNNIPSLTIAQAIEDLNSDFIPDRLGDTVNVQGVVFSPNYQTTNSSFYIYDGTAGTDIFMYAPPLYTWAMGDELNITGVVTQYNGMSEIVPLDSTGWILMSSGNPTPDPIVLTLAQFKANGELYEGSLVGFRSLSLVSTSTWPAAGSSVNLYFSDGVDTVLFRIDSDTDIDGSPEPTWPVDVIGIGSQYDNSAPFSSGYQVFPRFYTFDFLPANTIPVELTSFNATTSGTSVTLNWSTATELNNSGFDIERKSFSSDWKNIGFVPGYGTTTDLRNYTFADNNLSAGTYSYRLKQVDYDGTFEYSKTIEAEIVTPNKFELSQNYPNPFNPTTSIKFNLPEAGNVKLSVYNLLGQEVKILINGFKAAGLYNINLDAKDLTSGVYLYKLEANGINAVRKMTLLK